MGDRVFRPPHPYRVCCLLHSGTGPVSIHDETPRHPADRVGGEGPAPPLTSDTMDRLKMLEQDILSRSRLMGVINELELFKEESKKISSDAMVDKMRKRIEIDTKGKNTFILTFQHEKPEVAMRVTSRLGSFFVEENIRSREATAQETSKFLVDEVQETRKRLEAQEEKLKRYKLQFGGELPQQEQSNLIPAPKTAGSDQEQLRRHGTTRGPEGFPGGSDQQHREKSPGSRTSGSLRNHRVGGSRRHPGISSPNSPCEERIWMSCPRNTPRFTRPWCRRVGRWNNWRERLQQCARRQRKPRRIPPRERPILPPRYPHLTLIRRTGTPANWDAFADRSPRSTLKLSP